MRGMKMLNHHQTVSRHNTMCNGKYMSLYAPKVLGTVWQNKLYLVRAPQDTQGWDRPKNLVMCRITGLFQETTSIFSHLLRQLQEFPSQGNTYPPTSDDGSCCAAYFETNKSCYWNSFQLKAKQGVQVRKTPDSTDFLSENFLKHWHYCCDHWQLSIF